MVKRRVFLNVGIVSNELYFFLFEITRNIFVFTLINTRMIILILFLDFFIIVFLLNIAWIFRYSYENISS